jgi:hypothetical protein
MEFVLLGISSVSFILCGVAILRVVPSRIHTLNAGLPKGRLARAILMPFLPPGGRFDSPENLMHVRRAGLLSILSGVLLLVAMAWIAS